MAVHSRLLVPPPVWFALAGGLQHLIAGRRTPTRVSIVSYAVLALGSGLLFLCAIRTLRSHRTTISPEHPERVRVLVTDALFAHTRNPIYLALAVALGAHAALRRSIIALLPLAGFVVVIDRMQIPAEERALRTRFGRRYVRYAQAVPRWIGRSVPRS